MSAAVEALRGGWTPDSWVLSVTSPTSPTSPGLFGPWNSKDAALEWGARRFRDGSFHAIPVVSPTLSSPEGESWQDAYITVEAVVRLTIDGQGRREGRQGFSRALVTVEAAADAAPDLLALMLGETASRAAEEMARPDHASALARQWREAGG